MDDLISRQTAIDAVQEALAKMEHSNYFHIWTTTEVRVMVVERILKQLPTAEPKTGRWINANEGKWNTVEVLKCTACGEMDNRMYRTDSYCPNCGARMGGDAE